MADESCPAPDIDWTVLAPLIAHVVLTHAVVAVVRVTVSYRTIELGLPPAWLGVISAGFAVLPIFLALRIGRYIDRGHDAQAAWIGSALMMLASAATWAWSDTGAYLLIFTIVLGTAHMFLMASQQMLTVRCATGRGRDDAFGYFMVAVSFGQGLGPFIVGLVGGDVTIPPTGPLFAIGALSAIACLAISFAIRPTQKREVSGNQSAISLMDLLRRAGMTAVLVASIVTVTASDLLIIYLPLLGAERHIDAGHIGNLLMTRARRPGGAHFLCAADPRYGSSAAHARKHIHGLRRLRPDGCAVAANHVCGCGRDRAWARYRLHAYDVGHCRSGAASCTGHRDDAAHHRQSHQPRAHAVRGWAHCRRNRGRRNSAGHSRESRRLRGGDVQGLKQALTDFHFNHAIGVRLAAAILSSH